MTITLEDLRGRINDLDSHLMVPARRFEEVFGTAGAQAAKGIQADPRLKEFFDPDDEDERTPTSVWHTKGVRAPGAGTAEGRLETLDVMGVDRQLIFPQVMVAAVAWRGGPAGEECVTRFNDFVCEWTKEGRGRLRPTALLNVSELDGAIAEAERAVANGARAFLLPHGQLIAGRSPADPENDPLWRVFAEAGASVLIHIGGEGGLYASHKWADTEMLRAAGLGAGEPVGPYVIANMGLGAQHYVATLVYGGVFERHPTLRFGAVELGAQWVGPMAELLDERAHLSSRIESLPLKPSEYVRRNFRATPFYWESVATYVERYGLAEVYAYSSDFPHPEGGTDPIRALYDSAKQIGPSFVEQLFVTNAELILPD